MIWAVLDTNTLVSGMARGGVPGQVVDLGLRGHFVMVTSRPLLDVLARVLQYPKLAPLFEDPLSTVMLIERAGVVVEPTVQVDLLDNEPDNRVLEAAPTAHADFMVTGDARL